MSKITVRDKRIMELLKMSDTDFAKKYIVVSRDQEGKIIYCTSDYSEFYDEFDAIHHEVNILNTVIETEE